jgi:two-component system LytT family response regulator
MQKPAFTALVVDDEAKSRDVLCYLLETYLPEIGEVRTAASVAAAAAMLREWKPDLLFLDVEMPRANGLALLQEFPERSFAVIFTTAFDSYAIPAIKAEALDYLLKPVDPVELRQAFGRFLAKNPAPAAAPVLEIRTIEGIHFLNPAEIIRCEAERNYTTIFLVGGKKITAAKTLKDFEGLLPAPHFFRTHKTHLVNLAFAERIAPGNWLCLSDGSKIGVARRRKEAMVAAMARFPAKG